MIKKIFTFAMLAAFSLYGCKDATKQENVETTTVEPVETVNDDIVKARSTDKDGNELEMTFNNTQGTAIVEFKGETIELKQERAASGIWYTNDHYELRGKGNDIELKKDGNVVFSHQDEIITKTLKNKKGQTLDLTLNNTTNEAKVYLDGGEQIDLVGQKPASGIWYKNDQYELRGKGDNLELTKDGQTVFKN